MGYDGFDSWRNGQLFDIQTSLEIGLDDVICSSGSWDSCTSTTSHNCGHGEDVHLNCVPEVSADVFTIVNEAGEDGQGRGLLLFNGQTVCDDGFSDNSAIAICGLMGYDGFDSWRNGQFFDIQANLEIGLDDVICSSGSWDSCTSTTSHNCAHSEDVHLNCVPEADMFTIVNENGNDGHGRGLLLYRGQTVCDDGFSDNSAIAICGLMGYDGFDSWSNGQLFDLQTSLEIGLDNVECSSGSWDSCSYLTTHNCGHHEDVHLNCVPEAPEYPMFALVNEAGDMVDSSSTQRLLLLYFGQTVCDDGFSDNSAAAICKEMGYAGATSWANGELFGVQAEFEIGLDDVVCSSDSWDSCSSTTTHNCGHHEDVHLMCEVQDPDESDGFINVAADGTPSQSSTGSNGLADRAIDGNTNGDYSANSCTHTGDTTDGWWRLDFAENILIGSVIIYNRQDCCGDRINGAQVIAGDTQCGTITYVSGENRYVVECPENTFTDFIMINAAENQYLTLCEVKVLADPDVEKGPDGELLVNLALNKPASQSTTGHNGPAGLAVDGRDSGVYSHGTCTHTLESHGWWRVDLLDSFTVHRVSIKNREDCCGDRINGVQVFVGDDLCGAITYHAESSTYMVDCGGRVGTYIQIVNDNSYLTLCEVRVWGPEDPVILKEDDEEVVTGVYDESAGFSVASCPAGMAVTGCEVVEGGIGRISGGARIDGRDCLAFSAGDTPVTARAFCAAQDLVSNPCHVGHEMKKFVTESLGGADPSLSCPGGYEPELCNVYSNSAEQLQDMGIEEQGYISLDNACAVSGCNDGDGCIISLVCRLIDAESYAAANCATCDGYICDEGYECEMADSAPTCVETQTGCDVDKCGDGECVAVGAEGYTCNCNDGLEFNEVVGSCMPVHSRYETVYGEEALGDDAHSYAACGLGQKVVRCHTFGAPSAADGVTITTSDGISRCEARASHSNLHPVRAVAYCAENHVYTDPCTQNDINNIEYRYNAGASPHVTCPAGYLMESCIFHSPWTQDISDSSRSKINSIGSVDVNDDGSCTLSDCLVNQHAHMWCKLTAVCKKLTGAEYLQAACPTCDSVRCNEGMECQMIDDLPECVERIPGGCEVDNCGDNGVCVEDGPNYECVCSQGYHFDGETCVDVDECREDPCGNGDCVNSVGSYTCECDDGYELVHGTCEDINECLDSPCSDTERCSNVEGSYICDCLDTFVRDSSNECVCADGFENQDGACMDIDECADDPCGENEVCINSVGNYMCECVEEASRNEQGECFIYQPLECNVRAKKSNIQATKGTNVNVKLTGESKKVFKKYAEISWTKNGEAWNPRSEGKEKFNGFTIRKFNAEDAGVYVGSIFIDMNGEHYLCEVEVNIEMLEGSVELAISNSQALSGRLRPGRPVKIRCDATIVNLRIENPNDENNVNWYRVTDDGDVQLVDDDDYEIGRSRGTYTLTIKNPTSEDSGTYRCEFDQLNVEASTDVTIEVR